VVVWGLFDEENSSWCLRSPLPWANLVQQRVPDIPISDDSHHPFYFGCGYIYYSTPLPSIKIT
jgi:hypothetical protein